MKKVLEKTKDIVFFIKLYPRPVGYEKSKAIVCEKSLKLLEDVFDGKPIAKPKCDSKEIDNNIKLAKELGISGTPTLIFPDGTLIPSYIDAEAIIKFATKP